MCERHPPNCPFLRSPQRPEQDLSGALRVPLADSINSFGHGSCPVLATTVEFMPNREFRSNSLLVNFDVASTEENPRLLLNGRRTRRRAVSLCNLASTPIVARKLLLELPTSAAARPSARHPHMRGEGCSDPGYPCQGNLRQSGAPLDVDDRVDHDSTCSTTTAATIGPKLPSFHPSLGTSRG